MRALLFQFRVYAISAPDHEGNGFTAVLPGAQLLRKIDCCQILAPLVQRDEKRPLRDGLADAVSLSGHQVAFALSMPGFFLDGLQFNFPVPGEAG